MDTPTVTIYIPNFNYSAYIEKAIESVLQQSLSDFELLVIDDGSTDGSREVISKYEGHPRVRIILQDNIGLNRTNNVALRAARGRYIMRLDADDYLDRNALFVMVGELDSHPDVGLVFPDYYCIDASGAITSIERRNDFTEHVTLLDLPAHGACTMIRTDALRSIEGYSEAYRCQDGYDLWLRMIGRYQVRNISLPLFYYRRHSANITDNTSLIINTRAAIKAAHAASIGRPPAEAVVVIPERGRLGDPQSQVLSELCGKPVIHWSIEAALSARSVRQVIVTSPDQELLARVSADFGDRVVVHHRDLALARENVSVDRTVDEVLSSPIVRPEATAFVFLYAAFPFRSAATVEHAIDTLRVFEVDSVIGVVPETDLFFRHSGHGLELIGEAGQINSLRLERDLVYRMSGGIQVVSAEYFRRTRQRTGGRIGHVVLDEASRIRISGSASVAQAAAAAMRLSGSSRGTGMHEVSRA